MSEEKTEKAEETIEPTNRVRVHPISEKNPRGAGRKKKVGEEEVYKRKLAQVIRMLVNGVTLIDACAFYKFDYANFISIVKKKYNIDNIVSVCQSSFPADIDKKIDNMLFKNIQEIDEIENIKIRSDLDFEQRIELLTLIADSPGQKPADRIMAIKAITDLKGDARPKDKNEHIPKLKIFFEELEPEEEEKEGMRKEIKETIVTRKEENQTIPENKEIDLTDDSQDVFDFE